MNKPDFQTKFTFPERHSSATVPLKGSVTLPQMSDSYFSYSIWTIMQMGDSTEMGSSQMSHSNPAHE